MKLRSDQRGMAPLFIVLLLLLLAAVGFAAWRVWGSTSDETPESSSATTETSDAAPETPEANYVSPVSKSFRVVLPEGWAHKTCEDIDELLFLAPSEDKLGVCQSESGGTVTISKNEGNVGHDEAYYTGGSYYGDVVYSAVTIDGVTGYKVSYTVASENILGYPPVGTKQVIYSLFDGSDTFMLIYTRFATDADLSSTVQTLAESIDIL